MKHFFLFLAILFASVAVAQPGSSCDEAIYVGQEYREYIPGPCVKWYTSTSFNLPMLVHYTPDANNSPKSPLVELDLTCTPGVYEDHMIDSLVNMVEDFDIVFPVEFTPSEVNPTGKKVEWDLYVSEWYREQLAAFGVSYPVPALVRVEYYEAGEVWMIPDTAYASCMESAEIVQLGDTIDIAANDPDRLFLFSYSTWKTDSIRFVWIGDGEANAYLSSKKCDFPASNNSFVFSSFGFTQDAPHKLYSKDMEAAIKSQQAGGLYFAKVVAPKAGKMVVEKIPLSAAAEGAILLEYGKTVRVTSGEQLYCFPRTWRATEMTAPQAGKIQMLVSPSEEFTASATDENVIAIHDFWAQNNKRTLQLSSAEMDVMVEQATSDYLYVRFLVEEPMDITPNQWFVSSCVDQSYLIVPNKAFKVKLKSGDVIYRARYADYTDYDLTIKWTGNGSLPTYISETCNYSLSTNNAALLVNPSFSISRKGSRLIAASVINSWADRIEDEGFYYVRFNAAAAGNVTFATKKPEDVIVPEIPTTPDSIYTSFSATVCYGETYPWNDQTYEKSGDYTQPFTAANGADSIVTLKLTVLPEHKPEITELTLKHGETYEWQGKTYTESAIDTVALKDENDCDYLAILRLTILPKPEAITTSFSATVCYGDTYTWNDQTYEKSGDYTQPFTAANGADSIVTLKLTVLPEHKPEAEYVTIEYGQTYEWNGAVYDATGEYTIKLKDENGCEYQATLYLTVNPRPEIPCELGTIDLNVPDQLTLGLDSAFTVFTINYEAWKAIGTTLAWTGTEPLHTFVAERCEFAVAPYNKYVIELVTVPAQGVVVITPAMIASMAGQVDESGYVYVRFLTEKEGVLTITPAE